ncbi:hypothetical protein LOK49_LG10G00861 [Camellia lanceoleosa]|uniref:Uncharacterized protein n=1 Tax=Camellia lanceoleosa TaxID=1840588 RepID=A0ACC0GEC8_9ERIC|nr:hypothetical protein LOK49_LG10G00861 [Camellia lanceoleosa]
MLPSLPTVCAGKLLCFYPNSFNGFCLNSACQVFDKLTLWVNPGPGTVVGFVRFSDFFPFTKFPVFLYDSTMESSNSL